VEQLASRFAGHAAVLGVRPEQNDRPATSCAWRIHGAGIARRRGSDRVARWNGSVS